MKAQGELIWMLKQVNGNIIHNGDIIVIEHADDRNLIVIENTFILSILLAFFILFISNKFPSLNNNDIQFPLNWFS